MKEVQNAFKALLFPCLFIGAFLVWNDLTAKNETFRFPVWLNSIWEHSEKETSLKKEEKIWNALYEKYQLADCQEAEILKPFLSQKRKDLYKKYMPQLGMNLHQCAIQELQTPAHKWKSSNF